VGVSYNKFLAKLASDLDKPNGLVVVRPEDLERLVHPLPVSRLWGVGKKSAEQLDRLGLRTIGDVARMDVARMRQFIGSLADHLYHLAQGMDDRPVEPNSEAKSVGQETTFATDVHDLAFLERTLLAQTEKVARRLRRMEMEGRTVTLKLRYAPFRTITRSHTLSAATALEMTIFETVKRLLGKIGLTRQDAIRLIGVSVSGLVPAGSQSSEGQSQQLSLFDEAPAPEQPDPKLHDLAKTVDALKDKFGDKIVTRARLIDRNKQDS